MSQTYLEKHPPARRQFYTKRKATVTGAIVAHTAESVADRVGADTGAENVARFISNRTDAAGSYHDVVDSDSYIQLGRYQWQMFGEGTGGNRFALHLSFACKAAEWPNLTTGWVERAMDQGGARAANMAVWVKRTTGIVVPAKRITKAEYWAGKPGFIAHGDIDPGRRTDPGPGFPWGLFLDSYQNHPDSPVRPFGHMGGQPIEAPDLGLAEAVQEVESIYRARRGYDPDGTPLYSGDEIHMWRLDLHRKIYTLGENVRPTLAYLDWALANEPPTEGTPT